MAKENIRKMTHENVDRFMDKAQNMKESGEEAIENAKEKAGMIRKDIDKYIKANPEKSVLIAAGVGAALGIVLAAVMMKRRD